VKYAWIQEHKDSYPVAAMCRVLQVSKSGYYRSRKAQRTEKIHAAVKQVFEQSDQGFGSAKIAKELQKRDDLELACRNTAAKAMRDMGLKSKVFRKFKPTTTQVDPTKLPALNILNQEFQADAPNQKWVTDITYLATSTGWVYLAVIIDLFSRKVVGWSISESLATPLVSEALRKAIESRRPDTTKLLHHVTVHGPCSRSIWKRSKKIAQIASFSSRLGRSRKNVPSKRSLRANSGGSLDTSLAVQTTKTSDSWSLSQLKNVPNIRDETPESPLPFTPAKALSNSSSMTTHGAIASMILRACRVRSSVWPTIPPIRLPTSRISTGRWTSLPRALQNSDLPQPGGDKSRTPRGRFRGFPRLG